MNDMVTPSAREDRRNIGAILVDSGRLTTASAERIVLVQKQRGGRFGEAALALGLLDEDDVRFALATQFDYPYLKPDDASLSRKLLAAYEPFTPIVEQLRGLRSQLMLRWFDAEAREGQALSIVSPAQGEGRSFIAANLAIAFSQLGERTLLIDADLRAPTQHSLFKLGQTPGLASILSGRAGIESVLHIPPLPSLWVLPAGAMPPNPQELLGRTAFPELLATLARDFRVIIVDTPAADRYADAELVAVRTGAALLVARRHHSPLHETQRLVQSLQRSRTALIGSVLNDI